MTVSSPLLSPLGPPCITWAMTLDAVLTSLITTDSVYCKRKTPRSPDTPSDTRWRAVPSCPARREVDIGSFFFPLLLLFFATLTIHCVCEPHHSGVGIHTQRLRETGGRKYPQWGREEGREPGCYVSGPTGVGGLNAELFWVYVFGVVLKMKQANSKQTPDGRGSCFFWGRKLEQGTGGWRWWRRWWGAASWRKPSRKLRGAGNSSASTVSLSHNITFPTALAN